MQRLSQLLTRIQPAIAYARGWCERWLNCDRVEQGHLWLSKWLVRIFTAVWRWQGKFSISYRLAIGFSVVSGLLAIFAAFVPHGYIAYCCFDISLLRYLEKAGHMAEGVRVAYIALGASVVCFLAAVAAFWRNRWAFRLIEAAFALAACAGYLVFMWVMNVGPVLMACDHKAFTSGMRNDLWTGAILFTMIVLVWMLTLLLGVTQSIVREFYGLASNRVSEKSDETLVSLKTGGDDRRWRSSLYYALFIVFILLFGSYLMFIWGWEAPYALPKGGGEQKFEQQVAVKKIKKKKPKKLTVNPWSPYILERMSIDDVVTEKELEEESRDTYAAKNNASARKGGKGKGEGGWPDGKDWGAIRFIRLKYAGGDWDQDMGKGADYNLLLKFNGWTGIKIAKDTEFREIHRLRFFPHKNAPPFVFLTGMRGMAIPERDVKILRKYCLVECGMIFADNGGGGFDGAFRALMRRVFPGMPLVDIPNDDEILQRPFTFPDGAPPLWHHSGYRAMGIRHEGRWVVFYHPGDVNDAWKDGHSGASPEVADQAYKLGVNVMFYAFNHYYHRWYE